MRSIDTLGFDWESKTPCPVCNGTDTDSLQFSNVFYHICWDCREAGRPKNWKTTGKSNKVKVKASERKGVVIAPRLWDTEW